MKTEQQNTTQFPNRFQHESLALVNSVVSLSASGFYLVDPNMHHKGIVLSNIDPMAERSYQLNYQALDPMRPALYHHSDEVLVSIDQLMSESALFESRYYQEFMLPQNYRYVADMFFRQNKRIVAVLTMLRHKDQAPFSEDELNLLRRLHPFMEYSLGSVYLPQRSNERDRLSQTFELTARELDVLEFVLTGANNKIMARDLNVSVATVKTHLQHIYRKCDVASRTELLAKVMQSLS